MRYRHSFRRGFTLTEVALTLGIIGLIIGGIWGAAVRVYFNYRLSRAITQTMAIYHAYTSLYPSMPGTDFGPCCTLMTGSPSAGGATDLTCVGMLAGAFPADMTKTTAACVTGNSATYPTSPWKGTSFVEVTSQPSPNFVQIQFNNIPVAACVDLALSLTGAPTGTYYAFFTGHWNGGSGGGTLWYPKFATQSPAAIKADCGTVDGQAQFDIYIPQF